MAYINEQELNELRSNVDIVDVISSYIPLTLKGKNFFGVCPFHQDHSPSMSVSKEKQIYKCFSCGATGNVFTFVENYENVSFYEAVDIVAKKAGFTLSAKIETYKKVEKYPRDYEMMDIALKYYQNNLNTEKGVDARNYLLDRGLSLEDIKTFDIGLSFDDNNLNKLLEKKGYSIDEMKKLGLVSTKAEIYDIFFNRIMFPIHNLDGKCVGFTGRIYKDKSIAKYLGSKESNIYKKSNILFNYHRAKDTIKFNKEMIIVEGNMDAIRLYISGIKNVVALMGTALTKEQIAIIKKLRCKVILMLDNDNAGEKATFDNSNLLEKEKIEVNVVRLTGEKDPDDYIIKNGVEKMLNNIKNAIPVQEFKLNYLKKDKNLNNTDDLVSYIKNVIADLKDSDDPILKEVTLKKISNEYNVSYELLKDELLKEQATNIDIVSKKEEQNKIKNIKMSSYEEAVNNILYYMMNDSKYIKMYIKNLGFFESQVHRMIASEIIYYYELNKTINIADFMTYANSSKLKDEIMDIISNIKNDKISDKLFNDSINFIKKKTKENSIKELKKELKTTFDESKKEEILEKIIELKIGSESL